MLLINSVYNSYSDVRVAVILTLFTLSLSVFQSTATEGTLDLAKNGSETWRSFLDGLYAKLSEYEVQRNTYSYNVANLEDWGIEHMRPKPQGIEITQNNFGQFLNKLAQYQIGEYDKVKDMTVTEAQLQELNLLLNSTLKHKIYIECDPPHLIVKRLNLVYNSTAFRDEYFETWPERDECMRDEIKYISHFALNTLFIDVDMNFTELEAYERRRRGLGQPTTINSFMAPKWRIIGNRKMTYDGLSGERSEYTFKLYQGAFPAGKGDDGRPGSPGWPGKPFIGVGDQFENGANLTITSNGGTGGEGEEGKRGGEGVDGLNAKLPDSLVPCDQDLCNSTDPQFPCKKTECDRYGCQYKVSGTIGDYGGDGGHGGIGGLGGNPGQITFLELNGDSGIVKYAKNGERGKNGTGGSGGSGLPGKSLLVNCVNGHWKTVEGASYFREHYDFRTGSKGIDGKSSYNELLLDNPEPADVLNENDLTKIINKYKTYLRENQNDPYLKSLITPFLNRLETKISFATD